jgi:hypothetical protein
MRIHEIMMAIRTSPISNSFMVGISFPALPEDWRLWRGEEDPFPFLAASHKGHNVTLPLPTP